MTAFTTFSRKEVREIWRTWRIWVLPSIFLFFAVTGPILAKFTPELIKAFAGNQLNGIVVTTPTYFDAYAQWVKNLSQIGAFAIVIIYGGLISSETRNGTAILLLTKPISRSAFVSAKILVHSVFITALAIAGALITWVITAMLFPSAPIEPILASTLLWLAFGLLFVSLMALLSVAIKSSAGAAGAGLGVFVLISIASIWKPLGTYSPAALNTQANSIALGHPVSWQWPLLTCILLYIALALLATSKFRRKEL